MDSGQDGFRTGWMQDRMDSGQDELRTGRKQDIISAGQDWCRTLGVHDRIGMQDMMDAEQDWCRTLGVHDRIGAGQEGCRTGWMQDRMDAGQGGCRTGWMQDTITVLVLVYGSYQFLPCGEIKNLGVAASNFAIIRNWRDCNFATCLLLPETVKFH